VATGTNVIAGTTFSVDEFGTISARHDVDTINGIVINAGAVSSVSDLSASGTINFSGLDASKVVFTDADKNLTSTGTVSVSQGGTGLTSLGGDNTLLFTTSADTLSWITNGTTGQYLRATTGGAPAFATISSSEITNDDFLVRVPASTADNTVAPSANDVVSLTLTGTTGTGSPNILDIVDASNTLQSFFDSTGAFNTLLAITAPTTTDTINGIVINAGAVSSVSDLSASGTINFSGLDASKVVFTDADKNLTSTGTVSVSQGGTGLTSLGGDNTLLFTTSADTLSWITNGTTGQYLRATTGGAPAFATISSSEITNDDFLVRVPASTADNTVAPSANDVVSLTLTGTTGTGSPNILDIVDASNTLQSFFDSTGAFNTLLAITAPTTTDTINGIVINAGAVSSVSDLSASGTINFSGLDASKVVFTDADKNLTSTGTVSVSQGGTGLTSLGGDNTLLFTTSADTLSWITNGTTGQYLRATTDGAPAFATISSSEITNDDFLVRVPASTADNTVAPSANDVVSLTLTGTTGTGSPNILDIVDASNTLQSFFDSTGAFNTLLAITAPTTTDTINGIVINAGAVSSVSDLSASGTINFSGLDASKVVFTDADKNLTSTGTVSVSQGGTGLTSLGGDNTLLFTTSADTLSWITNGTTGQYLRATTGGAPAFATISSSEITNDDFLVRVPASTADNTVAPSANDVVSLTLTGTTGTGSPNILDIVDASNTLQSFFDSTGAFNTLLAITAPTTTDTINGLVINAGSLSEVTGITTSGGYTQTGDDANTFSGATTFSALGTALSVTNDAQIGGTLSITGDLLINTDKFTVDGSTGNATIAGTLTVGRDS
jgi:fibronectin-binding autotransporter adhesin